MDGLLALQSTWSQFNREEKDTLLADGIHMPAYVLCFLLLYLSHVVQNPGLGSLSRALTLLINTFGALLLYKLLSKNVFIDPNDIAGFAREV